MTEQEKIIAIAEWRGWTNVHWYEDDDGPGFLTGIPSPSSEQMLKLPAWRVHDLLTYGDKVPNYPNNLNACHEAEKGLIPQQRVDYSNNLAKICGTQMEKIFATSQQRTDALVKTIGKWKD